MKAEGLEEGRSACRFAARLQKKAEGLDEVNYELCTNCKVVFYVYRLEEDVGFPKESDGMYL